MTQALFPFTAKAVLRRVDDARPDLLTDPRSKKGQRYPFVALVTALMLGACTKARGLRDVEALTKRLALSVRGRTRIPKRISDTKLRDTIGNLKQRELRGGLHRMVKAEVRRGNLAPTRLPCGVVAIDGKEVAVCNDFDHPSVMKVQQDGCEPYGRLRVHRAHLVSSDACVCLDQIPIDGDTNEAGAIFDTVHDVLSVWGHTGLCDIIAMDAGNCQLATASLIDGRNKGYLMRIKANQPTIFTFAQTHLGSLSKTASERVEVERERGYEIERRVYWLELHGGLHTWNHARQLVRVQSVWFRVDEHGERVCKAREGNRYWISNVPHKQFDAKAWLTVCRHYWRIENEGNWSADAIWDEDAKRTPWASWAQGILVVGLLRMMGLSIVAVLRRIAHRRDGGRAPKWKQCARDIYAALLIGIKRSPAQS